MHLRSFFLLPRVNFLFLRRYFLLPRVNFLFLRQFFLLPRVNFLFLRQYFLLSRVNFLFPRQFFLLLVLTFGFQRAFSQPPALSPAPQRPFLIVHGTFHIGNGLTIRQGMLAIDNGIITHVGEKHSFRLNMSRYRIIDATNKHIYPGLIVANLPSFSAKAPLSAAFSGDFTPLVRAITTYDPTSAWVSILRKSGILLAQISPKAGVLAGLSSVVTLDGWDWEDATYRLSDGLHLHWPYRGKSGQYAQKVAKIERFLRQAQRRSGRPGRLGRSGRARRGRPGRPGRSLAQAPSPMHLVQKTFSKLLKGDYKLYVHAYLHYQLIDALETLRLLGFQSQTVLVGADDALYVADYLKRHNIPVLLSDPHRLPRRPDDAIDLPYRLPAELSKKGILVAFAHNKDAPSYKSQALPAFGATAIAYGLDKEVALQMLTINAAKILGIDHKTGTLTIGKDANLLICEGELLGPQPHRIAHAFIRGNPVILDPK